LAGTFADPEPGPLGWVDIGLFPFESSERQEVNAVTVRAVRDSADRVFPLLIPHGEKSRLAPTASNATGSYNWRLKSIRQLP